MRQAAARIAPWKVHQGIERIQERLQARERTDITNEYPPPPPTAFFSAWRAFLGSLMIDKPSVHYPRVVRRCLDHTLRQGGYVGFDQCDVRPTIVRNPSMSPL